MKLETFFEKFDELADTPNGVKQLRELVMQLAVEGGLVPHLAAEPAVPYASIEDATAINVSDVPENWRVVLLADAIKNRSGNSKLIKGRLHEEPAAGRFQGFSASGADVWCDDYEHEGQAIIISAVGARCGKAFKASGKWSAIANTNITRPEPSLFDFDFAYLVLNNEHFWVRGGSAQPFVKFPPSLDRHFALPPLVEQKRIVAKVNELMTLCDRLEAQQQERETRHAALSRASLARFADAPSPTNLNFIFQQSYDIPPADLRKTILTLAVQGKLVPQDPNTENLAKADFNSLLEVRKSSTLKPTKIEAEEETSTPAMPDSWLSVSLGELVSIRTGFAFKSGDYTDKGTFILRVTNINPDGSFDTGNSVFLPASKLDKKMKGFLLEENELLVVMVGGSLGKIGQVTAEILPALLNQNMWRLKPYSDHMDFRFLRLILSDLNENRLQVTTSTHGHLAMGTYAAAKVPFPPLAEQRRIVAKVEQLMALVDDLEKQLAASREKGQKLLEAVVSELTLAS
jgi:type I restriction enzyme S subunit